MDDNFAVIVSSEAAQDLNFSLMVKKIILSSDQRLYSSFCVQMFYNLNFLPGKRVHRALRHLSYGIVNQKFQNL